eukprot:COSAG01_NODE_444_length_16994_cov_4.124238_5_plen_95_part_00
MRGCQPPAELLRLSSDPFRVAHYRCRRLSIFQKSNRSAGAISDHHVFLLLSRTSCWLVPGTCLRFEELAFLDFRYYGLYTVVSLIIIISIPRKR